MYHKVEQFDRLEWTKRFKRMFTKSIADLYQLTVQVKKIKKLHYIAHGICITFTLKKKFQSEEHPNPAQYWREYYDRHGERVTINRASDDESDGEQDMEDARKKRAKVAALHEGKSRDNLRTIREQALEEAQMEPDFDQHIFDTVYPPIVSSEEEVSFHVN